jgi:hypothetical protein
MEIIKVSQERNQTIGDATSLPVRRAGEEKSQADGRKKSLNENETAVAADGRSSRI